jgi:hypothetical protein
MTTLYWKLEIYQEHYWFLIMKSVFIQVYWRKKRNKSRKTRKRVGKECYICDSLRPRSNQGGSYDGRFFSAACITDNFCIISWNRRSRLKISSSRRLFSFRRHLLWSWRCLASSRKRLALFRRRKFSLSKMWVIFGCDGGGGGSFET